MDLAPNADRFPELPPENRARWARFPPVDGDWFPNLVGLVLEDVRDGYCRMRLPYRPQLRQPAGVVHGGAVATLIDSVVVPAIGAHYGSEQVGFVTLHMGVEYLAAVREQDAVAEGWVERRGRTVAFCRVDVRTAGDGKLAATGSLVYALRHPS